MTARRAALKRRYRAPPVGPATVSAKPARPKAPTPAEFRAALTDAQIERRRLDEENLRLRDEIRDLRRQLSDRLGNLHSQALIVCGLAGAGQDAIDRRRERSHEMTPRPATACDACGTGPFDEAIPF